MTIKQLSANKLLLVLGLMFFFANGDNYAAASLLGEIALDLDISLSQSVLSVTSYMVAFGSFTLVFGSLADRFGKVRVINAAAFGTAIFSILGALSINLPTLIFFRTMNGVFGAGIFPIILALVGERFDESERQHALGKVAGLGFLGAASATAIGGALAYFGSWRLVYLFYGIGELALAIIMVRVLVRDEPRANRLGVIPTFKKAFTHLRFLRVVSLYILVGFSIFGSFTYSGILLQRTTPFNTLTIGLILSSFGLGTVIGGRVAPRMRSHTGNIFFIMIGVLGFLSLAAMAWSTHPIYIGLGLFGLGVVFICIHSTLMTVIQDKLCEIKGTAMSIAAFNLYIGASFGTILNASLMDRSGIQQVFKNASYVLLVACLIAAWLVGRFEMRKRLASSDFRAVP
jgi:predicted MFS family arabinose efflux permease